MNFTVVWDNLPYLLWGAWPDGPMARWAGPRSRWC